MADVKKVTEGEILVAIRAMVLGEEVAEGIYVEDVVEWVDRKLEQKAAKAEKAKEQRAAKAKENDELIAKVEALLTSEGQSAQEVTDALGDSEVSKAKVQYRLTALVKSGVAIKEVTKIEKSQVTLYKLA